MSNTTAVARGGAGIEALEFRDAPIPSPGAGEALVRLKAATLNFRDLLFIKGVLPGLTKQPEYVPLSCATGEVMAVGEGVSEVRVGDRVSVTDGDGTQATYAVTALRQVPKDAFPTEYVYGPRPEPTLQLVTCTGRFDRSTRHYRDNVVITATERR